MPIIKKLHHISSKNPLDRIKSNVLIFIFVLFCGSCKKFIKTDAPITSISNENVFVDDISSATALNGIYTDISLGDNFTDVERCTIASISVQAGLSSDELELSSKSNSNILSGYYKNDLNTIISSGNHFWTKLYYTIYLSNFTINGLTNNSKSNSNIARQLIGEAKFIRAFCYFYLVNLYGAVPYTESIDFGINSLLPKSSKVNIYSSIIKDLISAIELMNEKYLDANATNESTERVRPNKSSAIALLSRVYLYNEDYKNAELQATLVINNKLYDTTSIDDVFLKNSKEAIWQLPSVLGGLGQNTGAGRLFNLPLSGPSSSRPIYLSENIVKTFEAGDLRKEKWVKNLTVGGKIYACPYKYKIGITNTPPTEYTSVLRIAETYLIRAESRAKLGNLIDALKDLNIIRKRAGLSDLLTNDPQILFSSIAHERQVELFTEWAHRWLDLKRTNKIDDVMKIVTPQKGGIWQSREALYPLPSSELKLAPNLTQNSGY